MVVVVVVVKGEGLRIEVLLSSGLKVGKGTVKISKHFDRWIRRLLRFSF